MSRCPYRQTRSKKIFFQLATKIVGRRHQLQQCRQRVACSRCSDRQSPVADWQTWICPGFVGSRRTTILSAIRYLPAAMRAAVSTAASVLYLLTWCAGALVRQCGRCWRTTHTTRACARERRRSVATRWSSEERTVTAVLPTPATRTTSECLMVSSDRQTDRQTDAQTLV